MKSGPDTSEKTLLNILFWNINGRYHFIKDLAIHNWLIKFDLFFLSETHFTKGQKFKVDGYVSFHNAFSKPTDRKPRGGISCFIRNKLMPLVLKVCLEYESHIVVMFKGGHRVFGSYIPPEDSLYYSDKYFTYLSSFFAPKNSNCTFIGGGDYNSRVGEITHVPHLSGSSYRNNPDTVTNSHGKMIKNVCRSCNVYIVNNLTLANKVFDGNFTFFKGDRRSQNDLCISNITGLCDIESFRIHEVDFNFSDHCPISISFSLTTKDNSLPKLVSEDLLSQSGERVQKRQKQLQRDDVNWNAFKNSANINLLQFQDKINDYNLRSQEGLNEAFNQIEECLFNTALQCRTYHPANRTGNRTASPIVTTSSDVNEIEVRITEAEIKKWEKLMSRNDTKQLWKEIEWKEKTNLDEFHYPSAERLGNHFKGKSTIVEDEYFTPNNIPRFVPTLDMPITVEEISDASKHLKDNKTSADGWIPCMITSVSGILFRILLTLFNLVLQCALYPAKWRTSIVAAIFKNKGSSLKAKFYRPISLVVLLSKLFDFILLKRFKNWFIPHDCQSAYQSGRSCAEHVFLIRAMICHCIKTKQKLFILCVDFEGAFDRVSRHKLFRKMQLFGVGTTFLFCIIAIYSYTDCIIYQKETHFAYHLMAGIKQGLPLSPWLFLFYINDIFDMFEGIYGRNDFLNALHLLIHADDTTLIATSRRLAESKLRSLVQYCIRNNINLELSKCEFIVINGDQQDKENFILPNGLIKNVEYVTLLGTQISYTGKLQYDLNLHMKKRFHAISKFYNFLRSNKLAPISVKLKVLEACVCSALLHNCETFADKIPNDLKMMYISLIKSCLGVRKNAPNLLVLLESNMHPLEAMIYSRQLNFITKFKKNLPERSARSIVFNELLKHNNVYLNHYVKLGEEFTKKKDVTEKYRIDLVNKIKTLAEGENSYKYNLYMKFNPNLTPLNTQDTKLFTQKFVRLRLSSHSFPIETGRWSRTKREERLCTTCEVIGDEVHYIYSCVNVKGEKLTDIPDLNDLSSYGKLNLLLQNLEEFL